MKLAVIGLGVMGFPVAANLAKAGHEVVGYNRSRQKSERLAAATGSRVADSIEDAVRGAEAVITMLPDSPDVEEVFGAAEGVFAYAEPNALMIDMSTIRPDVAVRLHDRASEIGLRMLDAPVSGGEQGAIDAVLSIMCGGEQATFDAALPILQAVGSTVVLVGPAGSGQTVKAANQLLVAGTIELVSEALVFLDAHNVDLTPAVHVLNGGLAGSTVLSRKSASMLAGDFAPGFRVDLHHKDLGIYRDAARDKQIFSPLGAAVGELMAALRASGGGNLDHSALLTLVDQLSGRRRWAVK